MLLVLSTQTAVEGKEVTAGAASWLGTSAPLPCTAGGAAPALNRIPLRTG